MFFRIFIRLPGLLLFHVNNQFFREQISFIQTLKEYSLKGDALELGIIFISADITSAK